MMETISVKRDSTQFLDIYIHPIGSMYDIFIYIYHKQKITKYRKMNIPYNDPMGYIYRHL